jgi:hypothetical protein
MEDLITDEIADAVQQNLAEWDATKTQDANDRTRLALRVFRKIMAIYISKKGHDVNLKPDADEDVNDHLLILESADDQIDLYRLFIMLLHISGRDCERSLDRTLKRTTKRKLFTRGSGRSIQH